tara:strand:- start:395 stop:1111 length:717 start_codon:yes stop_codon:yes gene_type:complete
MIESKVNKYYEGYLNINETKEVLKKHEGEYKLSVYSKHHMYEVVTKTKAYDVKGDYLGYYKDKENIKTEEERFVNSRYGNSVVQINYKFYLLPIGRCVTIDEVSDSRKILKNSFNIKDVYSSYYLNDMFDIFHSQKTFSTEHIDIDDSIEACCYGANSIINNNVGDKILELNLKKYTKEKDCFIKENPEYKDEIENLYKVNIAFLMKYFYLTKKQLLKNTFNRNTALIKKLTKKINEL